MKGIILAGGKATRLYPITHGICKQLLPIYDKPMIYYPLSVLMLAGIRDILIISSPEYINNFRKIFEGRDLGLNLSFAVQPQANGIAEAFLIGEDFIRDDRVALILGDNIFYGDRLSHMLQKIVRKKAGATTLAYYVKDPQRYGVVNVNSKGQPCSIVEKPKRPQSNWALTGLYFYDKHVVDYVQRLKPSKRGELEITDLNKIYLKKKQLRVEFLGRGYAWLDTGTYDSLISASLFIKTIEERQGLKIGCIEEIAYRMGYISATKLKHIGKKLPKTYADYLNSLSSQKYPN